MKRFIVASLLVFNMFFTCLSVQAQTYEQAKRTQVKKALSSSDGEKIKSAVDKYSGIHKIDPLLIHAMILTESGYNKNAVSYCGARGLMQLMPRTYKARGGTGDIHDINENIAKSVLHLAGLRDRYKGNMIYAVAAYNYGGARIVSGQTIPAPAKKYVDRVYYHKQLLADLI